MNDSERIALEFLQAEGHETVVFEPNGNVPPDFVVCETIGVEVRRLNQNFVRSNEYEGLEEIEIPLFARMKKLVESLGNPVNGQSWWISYDIDRPMPAWSVLKREVKEFLGAILENRPSDAVRNRNKGRLNLEAHPTSVQLETTLA